MTREALDALEAWHATTRALRAAKPGSAEWTRLRMIAQEQRGEYEALVDDTAARREATADAPEQVKQR